MINITSLLQFMDPIPSTQFVVCRSRRSRQRYCAYLVSKSRGGVDHNNWDAKYLDSLQVEYAAVDANLSYEITKQLEIMEDFKFV